MASFLVVDDSRLMRTMMTAMLKAKGHQVMEAPEGQSGLEMAITKKPDCMLMDLLMPVMDGFALLAELQQRDLNLPVVVITADIQESVREQCLELGAAGFINKPIQEASLWEAIDKALPSGKGTTN